MSPDEKAPDGFLVYLRASEVQTLCMTSRSLGHRAPLLWLVLPLMAGLAAGKAGDLAPAPWLLGAALAAAIVATFAAWRASWMWAPAIAIGMFFAGNASYAMHRARLSEWEALPPREAHVVNRTLARGRPGRLGSRRGP